ncbi:MAG: YeeE/YedE family protein, partial [Octadecabacter sp.]|nr:YeeE/YedE family protein [Octadecabacter sp.]
GMILARGCASRLLVLSATGNLRAIITGLVLTLFAQASLTGVFAPAREALAALWQVPGGSARNMLTSLGMTSVTASVIAGAVLLGSFWLAAKRGVKPSHTIAAVFVGLAVAGGWLGTFLVAQSSFEIVAITSVTFTGPSTDTLMGLVNARDLPFGFGVGLVPGVFIGAGGAALLTREWHIERFGADTPMERYLVGAALMGFGSMLAGGCAVGAGMSGGAIFAVTAWIAVFCMWLGAMATHALLQRRSATLVGA